MEVKLSEDFRRRAGLKNEILYIGLSLTESSFKNPKQTKTKKKSVCINMLSFQTQTTNRCIGFV